MENDVSIDLSPIATAIKVNEFHFHWVGITAPNVGFNVAEIVGLVITHEIVNNHSIVTDRRIHGIWNNASGNRSTVITTINEQSDTSTTKKNIDTATDNIGRSHLTVTATKHLVESATVNGKVCAPYSGSIATAEDTLNRVFTCVDIHEALLPFNREVGPVATAKDLMNGVCGIVTNIIARIIRRLIGLINIHTYYVFRRTIQIVAAVHITVGQVGLTSV